MELTRNFRQLNKNNADIAGGKGASLGEMTNAGIPVPSGFVILSTSFDYFLKESHLIEEIDAILDSVNHQEIHTIEAASEKIQGLILHAEILEDIKKEIETSFIELDTEYVAVRSSATAEDGVDHAWAGQLNSYLNTTKDDLLEKVKHCWASLFTPRAIFYRFEKGLHKTHISVAVVVQKMVDSEVSGIAFSVHPVTEDPNQLIIEAGFGLGEAIVSGEITPDSYVVEKNPRNIIDITTNIQVKALYRNENGNTEWKDIPEPQASSQVLTTDQILELSELILKIENHYGFPCDIEWAFEKGKFYITQSRPITTLSKENIDSSLVIDPSKYQRLFQVGGMPYLVSDTFMDEYKKIYGVAIFGNGVWTTFLPKSSIKETLAEGLSLYSDRQKFDEYKNSFDLYKIQTTALFEVLSHKVNITKDDMDKFLLSLTSLFHYYRRTEFFATDEAYQHSLNDEVTKENLKEFEYIKNSGREYLNKIFFGSESYLTAILAIISKQFGISDEALRLYSKKDILAIFDGCKLPDAYIEERRSAYVMIGNKENIDYTQGKAAETIVNRFDTNLHEFHQEIKGQIANKGIVKGKAKVITADYGNFDSIKGIMQQMEKGDILIAETTSPELMPACSKASAIVTNQGGMMSHAAIVSREMNIPCIVGTGNATNIIKDGDLIEVDANSGSVKILIK